MAPLLRPGSATPPVRGASTIPTGGDPPDRDARSPVLPPVPYDRRRPEDTVLWQTLHAHWASFRAEVDAAHDGHGGGLPRFVSKEVEDYLRCGILAHGFLRTRCGDCGHSRLVAFACKRRGFCPSCIGRRMADCAAHLVDHVIPRVPVRQWVLTVPFALRLRMAYDPDLASRILDILVRAVSTWLRRSARQHGVRGRLATGGVTVIQRFNSAADLNVHFHTLVTDGVYAVDPGRPIEFHPTPAPTDDEVAAVAARIHRRVGKLLDATGNADGDLDLAGAAADDPALLAIANASVQGLVGTGVRRGRRALRIHGAQPTEGFVLGARCAQVGGFNLHANVRVSAKNRAGLESLCRYLGRPPLSNDRLQALPEGKILLKLKRAFSDGTTALVLEPHELIEKLVALVPRPRRHLWRYHGVFGPAFPRRAEVVAQAVSPRAGQVPPPGCCARSATDPGGEKSGKSDPPDRPEDPTTGREGPVPFPPRHPWAWLLWRVFLIDALKCDRCGGRMKIVGAVTDPDVARRILDHLEFPAEAPGLAPARGPPGPGVESWGEDDLVAVDNRDEWAE